MKVEYFFISFPFHQGFLVRFIKNFIDLRTFFFLYLLSNSIKWMKQFAESVLLNYITSQ